MLRSFEIALGFLTIFKIRVQPVPTLGEVGRSSWAFPLVGAALGTLLAAAYWILSGHFAALVCAVLVVTLWVVLTGGLHLDGWTDCWDALAASVSPERRREILKDSRLGTFGALGLILIVLVKIAAVSGEAFPLWALFLAPIIGRGSMVAVTSGARIRRDGMAKMFSEGLDRDTVRWACILTAAPALLLGWRGVLALLGAYLAVLWFRRMAESRLQTVNGDVIGAMCELSEAVVLLALI